MTRKLPDCISGLLIGLILSVQGTLFAAPPVPQEDIESLIRKLGSERPPEREAVVFHRQWHTR